MRPTARLFAVAGLLAAAVPVSSAGCHSPVPYQPSRAITRAIAPEAARTALRGALERQWVRTRDNKLTAIQVDEEGFGYTYDRGALVAETTKRYRYADLSPHLYRFRDNFFVSLTGPFDPSFLDPDYNLDNDCLFFVPEGSESAVEQAEKVFDALESLKAASAPRRS